MIGLQKTGGIGQYQVRFKSIGMQIQRIASRKLQQACRICRKRILGSFIVETILPFHNHRTNGVVEHHITEHFAESRSPIVKIVSPVRLCPFDVTKERSKSIDLSVSVLYQPADE